MFKKGTGPLIILSVGEDLLHFEGEGKDGCHRDVIEGPKAMLCYAMLCHAMPCSHKIVSFISELMQNDCICRYHIGRIFRKLDLHVNICILIVVIHIKI